ncbi:hypothetical protein H5991_02570 [Ligilactobacillus agilis]|uniref:hypothetical protein n=1 Tax=Ligilactobacillus agilis TaxID=1601 RepID=UPI00195BAE05|nr:hypothetical protein [Ligilactobacillus agilis]MBM6772401.1 hypothetical protein [Ligilactobacillus agilis]
MMKDVIKELKSSVSEREYSEWGISIQKYIEELLHRENIEDIEDILFEHVTFGIIDKNKIYMGLENIMVYNPEKGYWEKAVYILRLILDAFHKEYTERNVTEIANIICGKVNSLRGTINLRKQYSGSRYLLYENGIFDLKEMKLNPIKTIKNPSGIVGIDFGQKFDINGEKLSVPEMFFTSKHMHMRDLMVDSPLPSFPISTANEIWTPHDWLLRTNDGKQEQVTYFLQLLGAMLVPNHFFECFIEINEKDTSDKNVLLSLVKEIYNNDSIKLNYKLSELKRKKPFSGKVDAHTNIIGISEANGAVLSAKETNLISALVNIESMILPGLNPLPLLVIESEGWLKFNDVKNTGSGINRRLLPLDLTESDDKCHFPLSAFKNKEVIDWFNWQALVALHDLTEGNENFIFEIDDIKTLPDFARRWHFTAVNGDDEYMKHFIEYIKPTLHVGYLPIPLMYQLYSGLARLENRDEYIKSPKSFKDVFCTYLDEEYGIENYGGTLRKIEEEELGIDFSELNNMIELSKVINEYRNSIYAKYPIPDWIQIK